MRVLERCCCRCRKPFSKSDFYKTNSEVFTDNGYMPVCKDCLYELFLQYLEKYDGDTQRALKRICMLFDIYYDDTAFASSNTSDVDVILGNYFKRLNMIQYQNKTFDNTINKGFIFDNYNIPKRKQVKVKAHDILAVDNDDMEIVQPIKDSAKRYQEETYYITKRDLKRWGVGLEPEDYKILNEHYDHLTSANPNYDSNQEVFIKDLCYANMLKQRAIVDGDVDNFKKLSETYKKSFEQAGLKTVEETTSAEDFSMAVNVKTIEQYTPAEYYKDKKLYKDFDGIGDYFERFVLRPLKNLQHGSSDRDYEYYVKDEEEGDLDG